jgi:SpoVK/Ycf46/Vps4 family AAA+-type ATPase
MEKFLGTNSSENDGGVSRKASAKFLDWLSERVLRTDDDQDFGYVIGTMNSLAGLEPEFLRRFNATFFVDLPDAATRHEILRIQLRLNHAAPDTLVGANGKPFGRADWDELVGGTKDFSGSEIEQAVITARELAAESHGVDIRQIPLDQVSPALARPTYEQLVEAVAMTGKSIMARVHSTRIGEIREWCKDRALPVHVPAEAAPATASTRRGGRAIDTGN